MTFVLTLFRDLAVGGFLYLLPGWALLKLIRPSGGLSWKVKAGLAPGLSLALYPLLFLAAKLIHLPVTVALVALPGFLAAVVLARSNRGFFSDAMTRKTKSLAVFKKLPARDSVYFVVIAAVIFVSRMIAVRGMAAPAWGDSVHHTMIVRLLVENNGLFSSWAPYAPMLTFTYHFGFHSAAAAWAFVAGAPAIEAVFSAGQVLNFLAVLVIYPIGVKLGRSAWAGLAAMAAAGLFSVMPGFSVNWGRYTQLSALVLLPVVIWFLDTFWRDVRRPKAGMSGLMSLLFAGMFLSHYRVLLIALSAAAAWFFLALWDYRKNKTELFARAWRFGAAGFGAILLVSPWIPILWSGRTPDMIGWSLNPPGKPPGTDIGLWTRLGFYVGRAFWIAGAAALAAVAIRNRRLAVNLALWIAIAFLLANPHLVGLPGVGIESNFVLIASIYIPIAWLLGSAAGEAMGALDKMKIGRLGLASFFVIFLFFGFSRQARIVDPFFRLVEPNDVAAFRWIRTHTPRKARFMTNAILAFAGTTPVGSDAGWWIPYFTRRWIPILPLQFSAEKLPPEADQRPVRRMIQDIRATAGDPEKLARIFLREGLTYVYLGEKRGMAAHEAVELLPEGWFRYNPYFIREARFGGAEVWRFDAEAARRLPDL